MYIDFVTYSGWYKDGMTQEEFNNLAWEASRLLDNYTTGVDNVRKLREFPPDDEYTAESVSRCAAKIVSFLYEIDQAGKRIERGDGTAHGRVVSSVSSGSESVSYVTEKSIAQRVLSGEIRKETVVIDIVKQYLSGLTDSNGVNLLYMGRYPSVR